jgi:hypothetical protein
METASREEASSSFKAFKIYWGERKRINMAYLDYHPTALSETNRKIPLSDRSNLGSCESCPGLAQPGFSENGVLREEQTQF